MYVCPFPLVGQWALFNRFWIPGFPDSHRDVPCRAVPRSGGSVPCQIFPCRALMIRAVPNISVPCPHDPCPDLVDPCPKIWGPFLLKKKAPAATYPQVKGFQKYGALFCRKKKAPAATYPQVKGFQKFGPLGIQAEKQGFRTAWLITGQKFP